MGAIARNKWQAKDNYGVTFKYIAELSFERSDNVILGQEKNKEDNSEFIYFVRIQAYEIGTPSSDSFCLYKDEYKTLPEALAFFKNLGRATRAVPYEDSDKDFFCVNLYGK